METRQIGPPHNRHSRQLVTEVATTLVTRVVAAMRATVLSSNCATSGRNSSRRASEKPTSSARPPVQTMGTRTSRPARRPAARRAAGGRRVGVQRTRRRPEVTLDEPCLTEELCGRAVVTQLFEGDRRRLELGAGLHHRIDRHALGQRILEIDVRGREHGLGRL
jgi:hypothetical protein